MEVPQYHILISIHALLAESDFHRTVNIQRPTAFLSTLSLRRATSHYRSSGPFERFLSTLSLRRATAGALKRADFGVISIHALLAESDSARPETRQHDVISIHALLAESDSARPKLANTMLFLSTLSLRRATLQFAAPAQAYAISIHALLAESDGGCPYSMPPASQTFLSTLSLRRATCAGSCPVRRGIYFYPRSPCGERHISVVSFGARIEFLSTLSLRRATAQRKIHRPVYLISIHALLAESDRPAPRGRCGHADFYPRSPCGERRSVRSLP